MSKLILTGHEAQALITMVATGGDTIAVTPEIAGILLTHFLTKPSANPSQSELNNFSTFVRNIRKIVSTSQDFCISHSTLNNPHLRITIELDPSKDFTKPATDLSTLTITE